MYETNEQNKTHTQFDSLGEFFDSLLKIKNEKLHLEDNIRRKKTTSRGFQCSERKREKKERKKISFNFYLPVLYSRDGDETTRTRAIKREPH